MTKDEHVTSVLSANRKQSQRWQVVSWSARKRVFRKLKIPSLGRRSGVMPKRLGSYRRSPTCGLCLLEVPVPPIRTSCARFGCRQLLQCGTVLVSPPSTREAVVVSIHGALSALAVAARQPALRHGQRAHRLPVVTLQHLAKFRQRLPVKDKHLLWRVWRHKSHYFHT